MNLAKITAWLHHLSQQVHQYHRPIQGTTHSSLHSWPISTAFIAISAMLAWTLYEHSVKVDLRERLKLFHELMAYLRTSGRIEDNLKQVLDIASQVIRAPYYAFYIWDARSERFVLRAVSHPYDTFEGVGPAYSGLALPKKEAYLPPSTVMAPSAKSSVALTREGDVPMVMVRIGESRGLMRIGPVRAINRRQRRYLNELSSLLDGPLEDYINLEVDRLKSELRSLSDAAINKIASLATNSFSVIPVLVQAFTGIVGGKGGMFIERTADGSSRIHADEGLSHWAHDLESDSTGMNQTELLIQGKSERVITRSDAEFYDLPISVTSHDEIGAVVLVNYDYYGTLIMLYDEGFELDKWRTTGKTQLRLLTDQISRLLSQAEVQKEFSKSYAHLLRQIAEMIDNLNPYTVGYSEMMTRYSLAIGKELGLTKGEMQDLALAARLSNIGLVAMDIRLLFKEGRYSDFEYTLMKRHSEISASIIELVTGNRRVANYVLSHHERVDGYGYPSGLSSDEIPIGSKIIHTVQVFLAKVNGRSWRSPLPFELAMKELKHSAGTSLDETVVSAFDAWWERQGSNPNRRGKNLGKCYEMCCVPKAICESCPAYANPLRCWEIPDNHCKSHGRDCDTCFVKTEYMHRSARTLELEASRM